MSAELIAKLESASEGSRELDAEVCDATNPNDGGPYSHTPSMYRAFGYDTRVTTSIDAALALAERVLPGWAWSVGQGKDEKAFARLDTPDGCDFEEAYGNRPALAICAALLSAAEGAG